MADTSQGTGGLVFDKSKRTWPNELNILLALVIIIVIFELIGQTMPYMKGQSFLFDTRDRFDSIFNEARLKIIILQVAIIGIIDFLRVANSVIPGQTVFLGVRMEGLLFVCMIYWIGAYSMSKFSQRLERHLGVGEH